MSRCNHEWDSISRDRKFCLMCGRQRMEGLSLETLQRQHEMYRHELKKAEAEVQRLRAAFDSVYDRIAHGDDEHRAWLKWELDKIRAEGDREKGEG